MEKDTLMVLSGGLDSTSMLHEFAGQIALAVTFNYGSNHNEREISCAEANCSRLGIDLLKIDLAFMGEYFHSSLLEGAETIPEGTYDDANMRSTVVPFRNGIMLAVAAGLAESHGLRKVMMANHAGDHEVYPDCRPGFAAAMAQAISEGTYEHICLLTPYVDITKADIVSRGAKAGVDFALTYSCYKGGEKHCGRCATCCERREAFEKAGIPDPTEYEN